MASTCPYLKTARDSFQAPRPYPSHQHRCTAQGKARIVAPRTQGRFCLVERHQICPYFPTESPAHSQSDLPEHAPPHVPLKPSTWPVLSIVLVTAVFLTVVMAVLFVWTWREPGAVAASAGALQRFSAVTQMSMPSTPLTPVLTPTPTFAPPTPTATATVKPTSTPTLTPTPTPTVTPTPVRPPAGRPADRIQIPSIKLDSPIVEVGRQTVEESGMKISTWEVADYAVGVNKGSAYPGHAGNTVLSGHHNIKGEVLRYLVDVEIGDEILLYVGERVYPYVVTEKMILPDRDVPLEQREENARWIEPFPDERLTMVTCWPYENNTHRLIVIAKPPPDSRDSTITLPVQ